MAENKKFPIKDIIYIGGIVVAFGTSYLTNKVSMQYEIEAITKDIVMIDSKISEIENKVDNHEKILPLINYKLDLIMNKLGIEK